MDLTESIAPRSDQVNADDMIGGPATVTIESVVAGSAEQPVDIRLVEFPGRAYRPSKSMRRVLVALARRRTPSPPGPDDSPEAEAAAIRAARRGFTHPAD